MSSLPFDIHYLIFKELERGDYDCRKRTRNALNYVLAFPEFGKYLLSQSKQPYQFNIIVDLDDNDQGLNYSHLLKYIHNIFIKDENWDLNQYDSYGIDNGYTLSSSFIALHLSHLEKLEMCSLNCIDNQTLYALPNLRKLVLREGTYNGITTSGLKSLKHCTHFKFVGLISSVDGELIPKITNTTLRYLTQCRKLFLKCIDTVNDNGIKKLSPQLKKLHLYYCDNIQGTFIKKFKQLTSLNIVYCDSFKETNLFYNFDYLIQSSIWCKGLTGQCFQYMIHLKVLEIGHTNHLKIEYFKHLQNLESLTLNLINNLVYLDTEYLNPDTLTSLTICNCYNLKSPNFSPFINLKQLTLTCLPLLENHDLVHLPKLDRLNLRSLSRIDDHGLQYIGISLSELTINDLTRFTGDGLKYTPNLLKLYLYHYPYGLNDYLADFNESNLIYLPKLQYFYFTLTNIINGSGLTHLKNLRTLHGRYDKYWFKDTYFKICNLKLLPSFTKLKGFKKLLKRNKKNMKS